MPHPRCDPDLESSPPAELPESYREFQRLAEDVLMVVEPVLEAMESGALQRLAAPAAIAPPSAAALPPATAAPAADERSARDRHREARALLRAGTPPDEVARREKLRPGELRLIENLVAAEARLTTASSS